MTQGEAGPQEEVQFWPIRPTEARSLRPSDELLIPSDDGQWPQTANHGKITDIRDDEANSLIIINGELIRGAKGLFEKPAHPWEVLQRLLQPGGPLPGSESILVHAKELWKWVGATMNDPDGSPEQYVITTFRRVKNDEEIGGPAIEVRIQSKWNPKKTVTVTLLPGATIGFNGHR